MVLRTFIRSVVNEVVISTEECFLDSERGEEDSGFTLNCMIVFFISVNKFDIDIDRKSAIDGNLYIAFFDFPSTLLGEKERLSFIWCTYVLCSHILYINIPILHTLYTYKYTVYTMYTNVLIVYSF